MRCPILILALAIACHAGVKAWNDVEDRELKHAWVFWVMM